jgi:ComF family protein
MLGHMRLTDLLVAIAPPVCVACGAWAGAAEPLCGRCRRRLRWLGPDPVPVAPCIEAWTPLAYAGPARELVAALKFRGAAGAAAAMAAQIRANAPPGWLETAALVPVPLHPARRRRRGYNQAERLARALSDRTGAPVHDVLERAGPRTTQMGRTRAERLTGTTGRITATRAPPGALVLVDDVMTTGATLAACAEALRRRGATDLRAITYARTPGR